MSRIIVTEQISLILKTTAVVLLLLILFYLVAISIPHTSHCNELKANASKLIFIKEIKKWYETISQNNQTIPLLPNSIPSSNRTIERTINLEPDWVAMGLTQETNHVKIIDGINEISSWSEVKTIAFGSSFRFRYYFHTSPEYANEFLQGKDYYYSVTPEISVSCVPRD